MANVDEIEENSTTPRSGVRGCRVGDSSDYIYLFRRFGLREIFLPKKLHTNIVYIAECIYMADVPIYVHVWCVYMADVPTA